MVPWYDREREAVKVMARYPRDRRDAFEVSGRGGEDKPLFSPTTLENSENNKKENERYTGNIQ